MPKQPDLPLEPFKLNMVTARDVELLEMALRALDDGFEAVTSGTRPLAGPEDLRWQ